MQRITRRLCYLYTILVAGATLAHAQDELSAEDQAMNTLRAGIPNEADNATVDNWINAELVKLRRALDNPILTPEALRDFASRFRDQYNHADNSAEFKRKFAERVGAVFAGEYRKGQALDPRVGAAVARVVLNMGDDLAHDALVAGLASTDQVVRYLSALTLIKLQSAIAADAQLTAKVLQALDTAGAAELNSVVVAKLYSAAAFPDAAAATPVMLNIMDARLNRMNAGTATLDRGDVPALNYLDQAESSGQLDGNLRTQVVLRLARLLRIHTERYGAAGIDADEQAAIAETIVLAESLLKKITKPPDKSPDVSRELQSGGDNPAINMQIELIQWIGSPQVTGVLNKAPWTVPPGAP